MLDTGGEESFSLALAHRPSFILVAHANMGGARDSNVEPGHREAPFLMIGSLGGDFDKLRVDEIHRMPETAVLDRDIANNNASRVADLGRGDSDSLFRIHRIEQLAEKGAHFLRHAFDGL